MKLSIIIPTFNSATVLSRALDSIVNQTFSDWEILIMDGGSTDNTLKVAQSYNNSRIRIYSEPDKGIYDAMNKGIDLTKGDWIYFLGSDDWLIDTRILGDVFSQSIDKYDVVYGNVESNLDSRHNGEWNLSNLEFNRCHQAIFHKRDLFKKLGKYNLMYPVMADHDFNLKWFFSRRIKKLYIPYTIAHYSVDGFSSQQQDKEFLNDLPYLLLKRSKNLFTLKQKKVLIQQTIQSANISFIERLLMKFYLQEIKAIIKIKNIAATGI